MIPEIDKEILENYFKQYKSFFVTEYDAADKKLYLRIWLENDCVKLQQDFFSPIEIILYKDIETVVTTHNRLAIRCNYKPFPLKTIHIEGFEEPMCEPSDKKCTITDFFDINRKIIKPNSFLIDWNRSRETNEYTILIFDLFRLGKIDFDFLQTQPVNKDWLFNFLHSHICENLTKALYIKVDKIKRIGIFGFWDLVNEKIINEFPIKLLKNF